jgi:catalase-peroxidase
MSNQWKYWSQLQMDSETTKKGITRFQRKNLLIDKAQLLTLTAPEMTVLVGGMRALNANYDHSSKGVFVNSIN